MVHKWRHQFDITKEFVPKTIISKVIILHLHITNAVCLWYQSAQEIWFIMCNRGLSEELFINDVILQLRIETPIFCWWFAVTLWYIFFCYIKLMTSYMNTSLLWFSCTFFKNGYHVWCNLMWLKLMVWLKNSEPMWL